MQTAKQRRPMLSTVAAVVYVRQRIKVQVRK